MGPGGWSKENLKPNIKPVFTGGVNIYYKLSGLHCTVGKSA